MQAYIKIVPNRAYLRLLALCIAISSGFGCGHLSDTQGPKTSQELFDFIRKQPDSLVLFYSTACSYCDRVMPIFDAVRQKYSQPQPASSRSNPISFLKVNIDYDKQNMKAAFAFNTVPTFVYFKGGRAIFSHGSDNGGLTQAHVEARIEKYLLK